MKTHISAPAFSVSKTDTHSRQWAQDIVMPSILPLQKVRIDLRSVDFFDPFALIRLRGFLDWWVTNEYFVEVQLPPNGDSANYLARMHVAEGIDCSCCSFELPEVHEQLRSGELIELKRFKDPQIVDQMGLDIQELLEQNLGVKLTATIETFNQAIAEFGGNAVDHGKGVCGAYLAAQSYRDKRCVLAIGDNGVGIPNHLRQIDLDQRSDSEVLRSALEHGVTGTGSPHRGNGFYWVLEAAQQAQLAAVSLRIWSGCGRVEIRIENGKQVVDRSYAAPETVGTWIRLEFETD